MRAKIMIRVSKEEKLRLERIAWKNKRHLSTWVRERLEEVTA